MKLGVAPAVHSLAIDEGAHLEQPWVKPYWLCMQGGESIYGGTFADEFHSRLRFNHRGLVACANAGSSHTNGSQFFISLDRCDWLDRKNTIFGKVTGDSIFNLLRLGDIETDENDRAIDLPPRIISFEPQP
ncbi:Peptidyl-prolyl cis-trans isomerase [Nymphaea thermarum]|nr:Peptidyl-prolyl cis-trans isomerase [Nymphaea thermarum]